MLESLLKILINFKLHIKNTLFVGKVLLVFPKLDSTNEYALQLLANSRPVEGTVILTPNQTRGRGQIGATWESEPNQNITLSVIFYPNFLPPALQFNLNMAMVMGIREFIAAYLENRQVAIKWPNDILVENRKICGILIQNNIGGATLQSSIVGIGINVNQTVFAAYTPPATSFALETGQQFDLNLLVEHLCQFMEQRYLALKNSKDHAALRQEYLTHLYRFGEEALFRRADGSVFRGAIAGVTAEGRLLVNSETGETAFALKEISFV